MKLSKPNINSHLILLLFFSSVFTTSKAQNITAYTDYRNYLYVFDKGTNYQIEYFPVRHLAMGLKNVVYLDYHQQFKTYKNGYTSTIYDDNIDTAFVTDEFIAFQVRGLLYAYEQNRTKTLCGAASGIIVEDSLIVFEDQYKSELKVHRMGKTTVLEDVMLENDVSQLKAGSNIIAYVSPRGEFNVFYHDKVQTLQTVGDTASFRVGKNTVGYIDEAGGTFNLFYKGRTTELDKFEPLSYKAGDDILAYVDRSSNFKIFFSGLVYSEGSFEPDFYAVKDSIVVFAIQGRFKAFYKGKVFDLENYVPNVYQIDFNSLAYIDQQGRLKVLMQGKKSTVSQFEQVDDFRLFNQTLYFTVNGNHPQIFWNGKLY